MKPLGTMLLTGEPFDELVMGNTALVRAMIESGTRVVTSYPGSPTPEIADAIRSIPRDDRPFYFEFSTNEKVALEVAYGAAINGHPAACFFKSVGLNVAADTFVQLNHMNIIGGMVVILGDDPGANSSQNEQDNRHLARLSYTPVFEPHSPTEVYSHYLAAARLARERGMAVILRLTTHVCHAKQKVSFAGWQPAAVDNTPRFDRAKGPYVPITVEVAPMKRRALRNIAEVAEYAEASPLHRHFDNGNSQRGIITMGLTTLSLLDVLEQCGEKPRPDILSLAIVHPMPRKLIEDFLVAHEEVKILEELDNIAEQEIKMLAFEKGLKTRLKGKCDPEDWIGEYTADKVQTILNRTWPDLISPPVSIDVTPPTVPGRPPQMCPGCGHRSAFHAVRKALAEEDITVADIGCHTLGYLPPYRMGELLMCMGASPGIGSGLSLFNDSRRVVAFLGDSTLFHAGIPGIINAVFNKHNLTLILMENGTTGMTGHQDHAASGRNFNEPTTRIPVRQLLEGLGIEHILETDTYNQSKLTEMVLEAMARDQFSVVIAKHPCMLKLVREQKRGGTYKARQVQVEEEKCERIHECIEQFACPSFSRTPEGVIEVNPELCIGDGSCLQTCPVRAIKPVRQ